MIQINYQGGFGNSLFQYGKGCCRSLEKNLSIKNPLNTNIITAPEIENTDSSQLDILDGFFQDEQTIYSFLINDSLFIDPKYNDFLFVHVRLGDINDSTGRSCGYDYYSRAIRSLRTNKGFISSDSPRSSLTKKLAEEFGLEIFNESPEETITFAASCSAKVLSLGTFSWWIGFLGRESDIICPNPSTRTRWNGKIFEPMGWKML